MIKASNGEILYGGNVDIKSKFIQPTIILNPDPNSELA